MIEVALTTPEYLLAGIIGGMRNVQSQKMGKDKYGADSRKNGWQISIDGVVAELAWAKHKNKYYMGNIGDWKAADVDDFYEIRSTSILYKKDPYLKCHPADKDDRPYILALVDLNRVEFVGWLWGHEAKDEDWFIDKFNNGRPFYCISKPYLRDMKELEDPA